MDKKIILTGIKPTGMPHLGNYLGAIRPAIQMAEKDHTEARFFIADYHSLNSVRDGATLHSCIREVAAVWLASGLNPEKVLLYKQSDIPETFELTTILMAFTAKGLMNRAHAYKAAVDVNRVKAQSEDHQINMGIYTYPVLMAADILLFDTDYVPVGRDQVQHIEMAQDIAGAINHNYREPLLVVPTARVDHHLMIIPGLDGRKMSKSYDNHIPLFASEKKLRKTIMKIVTNSQDIAEPKDPDSCTIFTLYKLFSSEEEQRALAEVYRAGGMGWGEAKQVLFEKINTVLSPMREHYDALIADTLYIDTILAEGARRAREVASVTMKRVRDAVGVNLRKDFL